jgi:hypothetical protein
MRFSNGLLVLPALVLLSALIPATTSAGSSPAGKTFTWTGNDGLPFHVTLHANGTLSARSDNGTSSSGSWRATGEHTVCLSYTNPSWARGERCRSF